MERLEGKVVIVTGGGSGLGRASAAACSSDGADVVVADVNERGGRETLEIIEGAGGRAFFVSTDVTRAREVERMVGETAEDMDALTAR